MLGFLRIDLPDHILVFYPHRRHSSWEIHHTGNSSDISKKRIHDYVLGIRNYDYNENRLDFLGGDRNTRFNVGFELYCEWLVVVLRVSKR